MRTEKYQVGSIERGRQTWYNSKTTGFLMEETRIKLGMPELSVGDRVELVRGDNGFYVSGRKI